MNKGVICQLVLSVLIIFSLGASANDLDMDAIMQGLDIPTPANTSSRKGVISKIKGHKGSYFDADQFNQAFREGATKANDVGLPLANGRELKTLANYQQSNVSGAQGAWQFVIHGWDEDLPVDSSGNITIHKSAGIMANYGGRYEYVFYFPDIPVRFVDKVEEGLSKSKKSHSKIAKGVEVSFPRTESGQLYVSANYQYNNKTSTGELKNQVSSLILESRSMFNSYLSESRHVKRKHLDQLRKSTPANLEKEEFYQLLEDLSFLDLKKWDSPSDETEHGYAPFSFKDQNIRLWNNKNSFALGVAMNIDSSLNEAQQQKLTEEWLKWGQKKLKKGASNIEVKKNKVGSYEYWALVVTYPLDGTLKGKDIEKYFDNIVREEREDIANSYNKIKKKL